MYNCTLVYNIFILLYISKIYNRDELPESPLRKSSSEVSSEKQQKMKKSSSETSLLRLRVDFSIDENEPSLGYHETVSNSNFQTAGLAALAGAKWGSKPWKW